LRQDTEHGLVPFELHGVGELVHLRGDLRERERAMMGLICTLLI
jgi:hypothetical protein